MIDYFALLNEPRRPWLDPDLLKRKFLTLAAGLHPDRFHNTGEPEKAGASRRYAELNAAYHCLAAPKSRLRHLLELELGAKPKGHTSKSPPYIASSVCGSRDGLPERGWFSPGKKPGGFPAGAGSALRTRAGMG